MGNDRQYIHIPILFLLHKSLIWEINQWFESVCVHVHACLCVFLNLVSKVEPFLRTSSDVVRLPGSLHHRHSLSLANIAVKIAAFPLWPLPCNIQWKPQHTLACAGIHASVCVSVCAYVYLTKRTRWHTICFSLGQHWHSPLPSSESLPLSGHSTCKQTYNTFNEYS